ncbi:hypothetical protein [Hydrogenophaga sp.]|uniref:hypothetical protein n=1 Tax=Hydrogenophaga sp. TaxID=1904254 RepID=UPI002719FE2A|nr:hypothetical protein [Hydrogenophaga sp.]MDO9439165.1 hypothetical protein [Hydrogenophaga sp.]
MTRLFKLLIVITAFLLGGCAPTVNRSATADSVELRPATAPTQKVALLITGTPAVQRSPDWQTFRAEWRTAFETAASQADLSFAYVEAEPTDEAAGTTLVRILVTDFRYLTTGARYGFGVLPGNAFIEADAGFIELPSRRSLGSRKYATTSSAWQHVLSATTSKQAAALSTEIVQDLKKKK